MAREIDQPEVLHASDTVDTAPDSDPTVVTETRPAAVPANEATATEDTAPATYGERQVILHGRHAGMQLWPDFLGFTVALFFLEIFLGSASLAGYLRHAKLPAIGGSVSREFVYLGIGALVGVFLAYLIGGYAAGRMARFDGVRNGIGVWLWSILCAGILAIAGAVLDAVFNLNIASRIQLAGTATAQAITIAALVLVTLAAMLLGAALGGLQGERYHRRIDREGEAL